MTHSFRLERRALSLAFGLVLLLCLSSPIQAKKKNIQRTFDYGYALQFDGKFDFVDAPDFTFGSPLSLEFLVRPRGSGTGTILELANDKGKNIVRVDLTSFTLSVFVSDETGANSTVSATQSLSSDAWNYVVIIFGSNNQVSFYTEGDGGNLNSIGVKTLTKTVWSAKRSVNYLGRRGTGNYLKGDLDDVRVWNRVLNSTELQGGRLRPIRGDDTALLVYWDFNQGYGFTLIDVSVYQNHASLGGGSPSNSPTWIVPSFYPSKTCSVWSNNVQTLDGKIATVSKAGLYWTTKLVDPDSVPDLLIQSRIASTKSKGGQTSLIPNGFAFQTTSDHVVVDFDFSTKTDSTIQVNGQSVTSLSYVGDSGLVIIKTILDSKWNKHTIEFEVPFIFKAKITADPKTGESTEIDVRLAQSIFQGQNLSGLCGDFDGVASNDNSAAIQSTWPVSSGDVSLFTGTYDFGDPLLTFDCSLSDYSTQFQSDANTICTNTSLVSSDLAATCLNDVCIAGDLSGAVQTATVTYQLCVEAAASGNGSLSNCIQPCPNFCSLHGTCSNGVCTCQTPYLGADCSQLASYSCYVASWNNQVATTISPILGTETIVNHYQYDTPEYSSSNTNNEISGTTVVYLYQQAQTASTSSVLSLVVLHDKPDDGSAGKAALDLALVSDSGSPITSCSLAVKDDPSDNYNNTLSSKGKLSASWVWSACCTDGLAVANLPTASSFCAVLNFSKYENINQFVIASQTPNGEQEVNSVPLVGTTSSVSICGTNCTNLCVYHTSCASCMADQACGWCSDSNTCLPGTNAGPKSYAGQCTNWRYSYTNNRLISTTSGYPVDPSNIEYFFNSSSAAIPLQLSFHVRVPANQDVPLELLILQDVTTLFASDLSLIRGTVVKTYSRILDSFPNAQLAIATFSDKPVAPYGSPSVPDYSYLLQSPLTSDFQAIQQTLNNLKIAAGGDANNAQLEALLGAALRTDTGWSSNSRKIALMITRSGFHTPVNDSTLVPNNGDAVFSANENYPTVAQVKQALISSNVIPVFVVPPDVAPLYTSLVSALGFGFVTTFSDLSTVGLFLEAVNTLETLSSTVSAVVQTPGDIQSITPASYTGISPSTRVTFTVTLSDTTGSNTSTVVVPGFGSISFTQVDTDNPVPTFDSTSSCQNVQVTGNDDVLLRLTGSTIYGSPLTTTITSLPTFGSLYQYTNGARGAKIQGSGSSLVVSDASGRVFFNAEGVSSTSTFSYQLTDDCAACSNIVTCQVTSSLPKSLPVPAPSNNVYMSEDTVAPISLGGQSNSDSTIVSVITVLPSYGVLRLGASPTSTAITSANTDVPSNLVYFFPAANAYGSDASEGLYDTFQFRVKDAGGISSSSSTISVYVSPVEDAPVAYNSSSEGAEDTFISFQLSATDADCCDTLSFSIDSVSPSGGQFCTGGPLPSCTNSSTLPIVTSSTQAYFLPAQDSNGLFTVSYRAYDGQLYSTSAHVDITVDARNDPPVVTDASQSISEDTTTNFTLSATDVDNTPSQLGLVICSWFGAGTLKDYRGNVVPNGNIQLRLPIGSTPMVTYTPPLNFDGTESFLYGFRDSWGASSSCATFAITMTPVNDPPVSYPTHAVIVESTATNITLRGSDVDVGDVLTFYLCEGTDPHNGTLGAIVSTSTTQAVVLYSPIGNGNGNNFDSFQFKVSDGTVNSTCSNVIIDVTGVAQAPYTTPTNPASVSTQEDTTSVDITLNCVDPDGADPLTYSITDPLPDPQVATLVDSTSGLNITSAGTINGQTVRVIPAPNRFGTPLFSFAYTCSDGNHTSDVRSVPVTVTSVNDAPTANSQSVSIPESTSVAIFLSGNDVEDPTNLNFTVDTAVTRGQLFVCTSANCATYSGVASSGTALPFASVYFIPDPYTTNGDDVYGSFTFNTTDPQGAVSSPATVAITVTFVNFPPVSQAVNLTVPNYDSDVVVQLIATDPNNDTLNITVSTVGVVGSLFQYNATTSSRGDSILGSSVVVTDSLHRIIYTAQTGAKSGTGVDVIVFTASDPSGSHSTNNARMSLPPNGAPQGTAQTLFTINEDTSVSITLSAVDFDDPNNTFTAFISVIPANGTLFQSDGVTPITQVNTRVTDPSNVVVFIPALNENGQGHPNNSYTSFSYYVVSQNTSQQSTPLAINIDVVPVNDPPVITVTNVLIPEKNYTQFQFQGYDPDNEPFFVEVRNYLQGDWRVYQVLDNGSRGPELRTDSFFGKYENVTNANRWIGMQPVPFGSQTLNDLRFTYCDYHGACTQPNYADWQTLFVSVFLYNENPVAQSFQQSIQQPTSSFGISFQQYISDPDIFQGPVPFVGTILTFPLGGLYRVNNLTDANKITPSNPTFTSTTMFYAPPSNITIANNYSTFTYVVTDPTGLNSSVATVQLNLVACFTEQTISYVEGQTVNGTQGQTDFIEFDFNHVNLTDSDSFIYYITQLPQHGTLYTRGPTSYMDPPAPYPLDPSIFGDYPFNQEIFKLTDDSYSNWYLYYVPNPGYSSYGVGPDCFQFQFSLECLSTMWPKVFQGCFYIQDVNTPPTISAPATLNITTNGAVITTVRVADDSLNYPIVVTINATNTNSLNITSQTIAGLTYQQLNAAQIRMTGVLSVINSALTSGIQITPSTVGSATLTISVNDQGYFSEISPQGKGTPLVATARIAITVTNPTGSKAAVSSAAAGVFVGGTGIVSTAVYGIYRALKSKKLIPEEADPWANDNAFDATADNPLYASSSTPIYNTDL